jgi:hypothetical protein
VLWSSGVDGPAPAAEDATLLWPAWRSAAERVWATWEEVRRAPVAGLEAAYAHHFAALRAEATCADALAIHQEQSGGPR